MLTLDELLPGPHFRERHSRRIAAPPAAVWEVLQELRIGDLALSRALMGIRLLPARLAGREDAPRMVSGRLLEAGPVPVLAADPERAVVAGGVMQSWKLTGGEDPPDLDATALQAFAEPGWVKVGFDLGAAEHVVRLQVHRRRAPQSTTTARPSRPASHEGESAHLSRPLGPAVIYSRARWRVVAECDSRIQTGR